MGLICACDSPLRWTVWRITRKDRKKVISLMRKVETFSRKTVRFCEKLVRFLFRVEEAFDRTLRRFLKLLFMDPEADDLFVRIDHGVDHAAVFFHLVVEGVLV